MNKISSIQQNIKFHCANDADVQHQVDSCYRDVCSQPSAQVGYLYECLQNNTDIHLANNRVLEIKDRAEHLVVLGTGGSSMNGMAFAALANINSKKGGGIEFWENLDPFTVMCATERVNWQKTHFVAISKSGETIETFVLLLFCLQQLKRRGLQPSRYMTFITDPTDTPLRRLASELDVVVLDHPLHIGGRFSTFSVVGLFPALWCGLDGEALRSSAKEWWDSQLVDDNYSDTILYHALCFHIGSHKAGYCTNSLMPYVDGLLPYGRWARQLWAESLGKSGHNANFLLASGSVDQHSQLQLFMDGPRDKYFTFIRPPLNFSYDIDSICLLHGDWNLSSYNMAYLSSCSFRDILDAECLATEEALSQQGYPTRHWTLNYLDGEALSALLVQHLLETLLMANYWRISPFGQPAVELGKKLARERLALVK
jgi:glucose-6-phosphate isomerase